MVNYNINLEGKTVLVTGAAGFIGSNLVKRLFHDVKNIKVIGIDSITDYYDVIEAMVSNLNKQLCEKVDQLNDMMQKLMSFSLRKGEVNLSDSLREAVVAGVRAEFEAREQKLKDAYANELEKLTADFNARLAAKQNEINQLKGISDWPSANN